MPGSVSDSYDPEFGTVQNVFELDEALKAVYERVTAVLSGQPPLPILDVVKGEFPTVIPATLSEREWRLIRFALETARDVL